MKQTQRPTLCIVLYSTSIDCLTNSSLAESDAGQREDVMCITYAAAVVHTHARGHLETNHVGCEARLSSACHAKFAQAQGQTLTHVCPTPSFRTSLALFCQRKPSWQLHCHAAAQGKFWSLCCTMFSCCHQTPGHIRCNCHIVECLKYGAIAIKEEAIVFLQC